MPERNMDAAAHLPVKKISLWLMAFLYIVAGIAHFLYPQFYRRIIPSWVPAHEAVIYITGVCEIVLGLLLFPFVTRQRAAWGIILLLIVVFPANIQMALNYFHEGNPFLWIAILRLPLQILLIWWAYGFTKSRV